MKIKMSNCLLFCFELILYFDLIFGPFFIIFLVTLSKLFFLKKKINVNLIYLADLSILPSDCSNG
jgi:hypothetical protein